MTLQQLKEEARKILPQIITIANYEYSEHDAMANNPTPEEEINSLIDSLITKAYEEGKSEVDENTSDGYHTLNELYEFRKIYNATLFNEWTKQNKYDVHKSKKHYDGEDCFGGGWFIVVAILPSGQISNHYELKDWDLFQCEETEKAKYEFDGHTAKDVLERLKLL